MLNVFEGIRSKPVGWAKGGFYAILIAGAYFSAFQWLIGHVWGGIDSLSGNLSTRRRLDF